MRALLLSALLSATVALSASACGGSVNFQRNSDTSQYRSLPRGSEIAVLAGRQEIPVPSVVLGALEVETSGEQPERELAIAKFKQHAEHYGCDAIAAIKVSEEQRTIMKKEKVKSESGPPKWVNVEHKIPYYRWSAECVRTAQAPGGLTQRDQKLAESAATSQPTAQPVAAPTPQPAPAPAPAPAPVAQVDPQTEVVWARLASYGDSYLKAWKPQLANPAPSALETLEALNELMLRVSGPTGFWRKQVPGWFGCAGDPAKQQCQTLSAANRGFARYDKLQAEMQRLTSANAGAWIQSHYTEIIDYFDTYVPAKASLEGMQETAYFKTTLKSKLLEL